MKNVLYLLLFASGAALADDAAILKCRELADSSSRLACYDAIELGVTAPKPAAAPAKAAEQSFGIEAVKQRQEQPSAIESTIVGQFDGWRPNAQITLANGQVWRIIDGSEAVLPPTTNQKVRIERNLFGTLFLKVEGTNSSAKVRRVK